MCASSRGKFGFRIGACRSPAPPEFLDRLPIAAVKDVRGELRHAVHLLDRNVKDEAMLRIEKIHLSVRQIPRRSAVSMSEVNTMRPGPKPSIRLGASYYTALI